MAWFTGLVNKQNGYLDEAIANFRSIVELDDEETPAPRLRLLARTTGCSTSSARRSSSAPSRSAASAGGAARGAARARPRASSSARSSSIPRTSRRTTTSTLIYKQLGDDEQAAEHSRLHAKYKPDDNARDRAIATHRAANPAANHAAEAIVIYDLHRAGAFGLRNAVAATGNPTATGAPAGP